MYIIYFFSALMWLGLTCIMYRLNNLNIKIARNFISFFHATSVIVFYMFDLPHKYLFYVSIGYYLIDGIVELYYLVKTNRLYNLTVVIHHIISSTIIYKLTDPTDIIISKFLLPSFFMLELSNCPIYLVYYLRAINYNDIVIKLLTIVEIIVYIILRIYMCGMILYEAYISKNFPLLPFLSSCLIYIMSIIWLCGMFLHLFKKPVVKQTKYFGSNIV